MISGLSLDQMCVDWSIDEIQGDGKKKSYNYADLKGYFTQNTTNCIQPRIRILGICH